MFIIQFVVGSHSREKVLTKRNKQIEELEQPLGTPFESSGKTTWCCYYRTQ